MGGKFGYVDVTSCWLEYGKEVKEFLCARNGRNNET